MKSTSSGKRCRRRRQLRQHRVRHARQMGRVVVLDLRSQLPRELLHRRDIRSNVPEVRVSVVAQPCRPAILLRNHPALLPDVPGPTRTTVDARIHRESSPSRRVVRPRRGACGQSRPDRYVPSQSERRGSPEARQDPARPPGRALRAQSDTPARAECESDPAARPASTPTRAASSSGVGTPRTHPDQRFLIHRHSLFGNRPDTVTRIPPPADQLAVARHDRVFSA